MSKTYAQKADVYFKVLEKNPNLSAADLDRRYKGTEYAMRKQDRLDLVREIKSQLKQRDNYIKRINNSDMTDKTKQKLIRDSRKIAYQYAKNNTRKGKELNKKGVIYGAVDGMSKRTFARYIGNASDYVEFYG
jgi:hypothetical protein